MIDKEKLELVNLRKRVVTQREEIKELRKTVAMLKEKLNAASR